jgi:hypothetical protein
MFSHNSPVIDDNDDDEMMSVSPCGQLGLWAPSSGARVVFTSTVYDFTYDFPVIKKSGHPY